MRHRHDPSRPLPSEITPSERYYNRREIMASLAAARRRRPRSRQRRGRIDAAEVRSKSEAEPGRASQFSRRYNDLQQLLRIRHRKVRPRRALREVQAAPVDRESLRRGRADRHLRAGRPAATPRARGTHLPAALRRSLVDGHSVGRIPARRPAQALRAELARQVRRVQDGHATRRDAGTALPGARLAVRRRPAHRRGHAPADDHCGRPVRRDAAEPERRAAAPGRAVEIRLQGHQVDRRDPLHREAAADELEPVGAARVRLLRQREPSVDHPRWSQATERRIGASLFAPRSNARCPSTGMPSRWPRSTAAWTCASSY